MYYFVALLGEWKPNLWPRIRERERDLKGMMYLR